MFKPGTGMEKVKPLSGQTVGTAGLRSPSTANSRGKFVMPEKLDTNDKPRPTRVGPRQLIIRKKVHEAPKKALQANSNATPSTADDDENSVQDDDSMAEDDDSMPDEEMPITPLNAVGARRRQGSGFLTLILGKSRIRWGIKGATFLLLATCGFLLFYSKAVCKNEKLENVISPPTSLLWNDDDTAGLFAMGGFVASSLLAMSIGPLLRRCMNSQTTSKDSKTALTFVIFLAYELMWAGLIVQAVIPYPGGDAEQSKSRTNAFLHLLGWGCFVGCALIHANLTVVFYGDIDDGDDHFLPGRTGWGVAMFFFALIGGGSHFMLDKNSDNLKSLVGLAQYLFFISLMCSLSYYYMDSSLLAAEKRDGGRIVATVKHRRGGSSTKSGKKSGESGYGASEKMNYIGEKNSAFSQRSRTSTRTLTGPQLISVDGVKEVTGLRHFSKLPTFTIPKPSMLLERADDEDSERLDEVAVWSPDSGSKEKMKTPASADSTQQPITDEFDASGFQCIVEDNQSSQCSGDEDGDEDDDDSSSSEMELEPRQVNKKGSRNNRRGMFSKKGKESGKSQEISDES